MSIVAAEKVIPKFKYKTVETMNSSSYNIKNSKDLTRIKVRTSGSESKT